MDDKSLAPVAWRDEFATGIESIDAQHRAIGELLNRAIALAERNDAAARAEMADVLGDLAEGLMGHLRHEAATIPSGPIDARMRASADELERARAEIATDHAALKAARAEVAQARDQLVQSEKMAAIGQLAAGVAHEINNPVGFVSSNLGSLGAYVKRLFDIVAAYERLAEALPPDHPQREAVEAARRAAEYEFLKDDIPDLLSESTEGLARVKRIVDDLKNFSRIGEAEFKPADINAGISTTLNVVWNELKYKAEVTKDFGDLPLVRCIASQLNQVFMNLLVNAAQAIETSGAIRIRTGVAGERVWIEIEDTGKGMPADVQHRIFEPFFTTKPVGKGTGLGLSISLDIVKRHGGSLGVRSSPGAGTVFRIELPVDGPVVTDTAET